MRRIFQQSVLLLTLLLGAGALLFAQEYPPYGGGPDGRYNGGRGYGYYGNDPSRIGFMDGERDGQHDFYTGHSYRPTHDHNFKHADRGYDHHFGPKWQYKETYRDAYVQGYQRGYGQGGRGGYRRGYPRDYDRGYRW